MEFKYGNKKMFLLDENEKEVAYAVMPLNDGVVEVTSTFVDASLRGQGIADKLMHAVHDFAVHNVVKVKPVCSYAVKWYAEHEEFSGDLV